MVDALRYPNLSFSGYPIPTSPNIDRLAKEGLTFKNAFSTSNATDPSLTTIMTGRYPIMHGIRNHGWKVTMEEVADVNKTVSLPMIFRKNNYVTIAIDWIDRWHKRGFDYYVNPRQCTYRPHTTFTSYLNKVTRKFRKLFEKKVAVTLEPLPRAEDIVSLSMRMLKKVKNQRFFLFLHFWDTHAPYLAPRECIASLEKYRAHYSKYVKNVLRKSDKLRLFKRSIELIKNPLMIQHILMSYDAAILSVDQNIGKLLDELDYMGLLKDTLLIVTADHGESLLEHGIFFDHHGLYDVSIHVPLILWGSIFSHKEISCLVQHTAIAPTLVEVLKLKDSPIFDDISLLSLIEEKLSGKDFIYSEETFYQFKRTIRTDRYKYIEPLVADYAWCRRCRCVHGVVELYDLEKDPQEIVNVVSENRDISCRLKNLMHSWLHSLTTKRILRKKIDAIRSKMGVPA